jgi:hypothetical protein
MRRLWLALLVFFIIGVGSDAAAQASRKSIRKNNKRISSFRGKKNGFAKSKRYSQLGVSLNSLNYYGDLAPGAGRVSTDIKYTRSGYGVSWATRFGPRYSFQTQYMYGVLKGSDIVSADPSDMSNGIYRYKRNLSFRNEIHELSAIAVVDLFENQGNYISRAAWTPYIYLGVAALHHNPEAEVPATDLSGNPLPQAGDNVKLRPLGTEGQYSTLLPTDANAGIEPYSLVQVAIPLGFGARIKVTETLDLWVDLGFRYTFTDYLDDVSANYVDLGVLSSPLAKAMSYRTGELNLTPSNESTYVGRDGVNYTVENGYGSEHPDNMRGGKADNDLYMVTSIRLTYILGATFHRAKFR